MKNVLFAAALLVGSAAIAQTNAQPELDVDANVGVQPDGDLDVDADVDLQQPTTTAVHSTTHMTGQTMAMNSLPAVVQPSNADPERDARGIAVISDPAVVPSGYNGVTGTAMGGPLVDPATGETIEASDADYPACTATVTDNCIQTYEVGRRR